MFYTSHFYTETHTFLKIILPTSLRVIVTTCLGLIGIDISLLCIYLINTLGLFCSLFASEVAEIFNTFYGSIADYPVGLYDGLNNTFCINLVDVMNKHCLHVSIVNIKSHMGVRVSNFDFHDVSVDDILKKIICLKSGISPGYDGIQATFFKMVYANFASSLRTLFNKCISTCIFPTSMKMADISPILKGLIIYVRTIIDR